MAENSSFDSLDELRNEHGRLLRTSKESTSSGEQPIESIANKVVKFLVRARATGAILDYPTDRDAAQSVLDYWTATLFTLPNGVSATQALPTAIPGVTADAVNLQLEVFDPRTIDNSIRDADTWLAMPGVDRQLVRRLLLRLVRLPADKQTFDNVPTVRGSLYDLDTEESINALIDQLATAGVVRVTKGDSNEMDRVALRSPELLKRWPELRKCCDARTQFRARVAAWDSSGRPKDDLLTGAELDEAREYHDRNLPERDFINASVDHQALALRQAADDRRKKRLFIALTVFAILGWIGTFFFFLSDRAKRIKDTNDAAANLERVNHVNENREQFNDLRRLVQAHARVVVDARDNIKYPESLAEWRELEAEFSKKEPFSSLWERERSIARSAVSENSLTLSKLEIERIHGLFKKFVDGANLDTSVDLARDSSFTVVTLCVRSIVDALSSGSSIGDVEEFTRQFWMQYWGDMLLFESPEIESEMVKFGNVLTRIDSEVESPDDELWSKITDVSKKYLNARSSEFSDKIYRLNAESVLRLEQEFKEVPKEVYGDILQYVGRRKLSKDLVLELKESGESLLQALGQVKRSPVVLEKVKQSQSY